MFRRLEKIPAFELLSVGLGPVDGNDKTPGAFSTNQLWRKYTLAVPHFECEILEVFPAREMFLQADAWLTGEYTKDKQTLAALKSVNGGSTFQQGLSVVLGLGLFLLVGFEIAIRNGGHFSFC